jgi:hypothetical protein
MQKDKMIQETGRNKEIRRTKNEEGDCFGNDGRSAGVDRM